MALPENLSPENVVGTVLAGVAIAILIVWQYLKERKSPSTRDGDRMIPGVTIADMTPIRELAAETAKTNVATERIATAIEKLLTLSQERADEEEILRRAEMLAQQMIKQLPETTGRRPRRMPP